MEEILTLAARQYGLFTAAQWIAAGLSRRNLTYKKARGWFSSCTRASSPWQERPPVSNSRYWRYACQSTASLRTAVRRRLGSSDVETLRGIPITSRARTLLDLCDVSPHLVEGALNGALHKRRVGVRQLQETLDRVTARHPGARLLRDLVVPFAAGQRPTESELEDDFLELVIRKYNLPVPVRQHPVGRRSIDFAYPELTGVGARAQLEQTLGMTSTTGWSISSPTTDPFTPA